jgi:hypothetical protein
LKEAMTKDTTLIRRCRECGGGKVVPLARAGRRTRYKTMELEIPQEVEIPTCDNCGAEWMDRQTARAIDQALERTYRDALRVLWADLIQKITARTSMRRVEQTLGLSEGYLSKVTNGRSEPSAELISNLSLIAKDVEPRLREIDGLWRRAPAMAAKRLHPEPRRAVSR